MSSLLASRYEMVAALGAGGFGETFLARDTHLPSQRMVVVKRLKPTQGPNDVVTKLFQKEAAVLEELGANCSQIPQLYSYFMDNGEFFLVQEYVEGKNLAQFSRMGSEQVKRVLSSLLTTLQYVHSKGIIHRDIKPENIILRERDGLPVLIDFGAVKETMGAVTLGSGSMVSSVIVGTRGFMAPEQSAGQPVFSTDLYALALTMIYALTQKLPIEFGTSQLTGDLDWQGEALNLDPQLARILDKAIKMEISSRYPTAEAMYQDLVPQSQALTQRIIPDSQPSLLTNSQSKETIVISPALEHQASEQRIHAGSQEGKSANTGILVIGIVAVMAILGLSGGFFVMQQLNQSHLQALQSKQDEDRIRQQELELEKLRLETEKIKLEQKSENQEDRGGSSQPSPIITTNNGSSNPLINSYASISRQDAISLIERWLNAKGEIFGSSYNRSALDSLLTGKAYQCNLESVDWLENNGAYYTYGVQRIDSVNKFVASGDKATISISFTEERTLHNANGGIDRNASKFGTVNMTYNLEMVGGEPRIAYFRLPGC